MENALKQKTGPQYHASFRQEHLFFHKDKPLNKKGAMNNH
jgi:hypothetical protein